MIQITCLLALIVLVIIRGPRAASNASARPAWWATVSGVISLATYGFPVPFPVFDAILGGSNVTTLIRDLGATSAFWFFREALARRAGIESTRSRWGLAVMFASYTIPFFLIADRGPSDVAFITDRLDQTAVWIYGAAYMTTLIWISVSAILIARLNWRGVQSAFISGLVLVIAGCLIEIVFLTASHFGYGGQAFRYSAWNLSELPFFLGLLVIIVGIGWVAIVSPSRRRILLAKLRRIAKVHQIIDARTPRGSALLSERELLHEASQLMVLVSNAELRGDFSPSFEEKIVLDQARNLIHRDHAFRPITFRNAA
jgi:hypothetical protein